MNNMIGFLDVNAESDGNRRENNHPKPGLSLKIINQALAAVLTLTLVLVSPLIMTGRKPNFGGSHVEVRAVNLEAP